MQRPFPSLHVVAALLTMMSAGCDLEAPAATGVARLLARPTSVAGRIARVAVTVTPGDGAGFSPLHADLARDGDDWRGRVARIPVGAGRRFDAVAYDAAGQPILAGAARSDVTAQGAAIVVLVLDAGGAPAFDLGAIAYAPSWTPRRGVVTLTATPAHDPEPGELLTYRWSASCTSASPGAPGTFDDPSSASTRWTAPDAPSSCHLTLTATDGLGRSAQASVTIPVLDTGDSNVVAAEDAYPVILALRATIRLGDPTEADLAVEAVDPEGTPLTYDWTSDGPDGCAGLSLQTAPPYAPSAPHLTLPPPAATCRVDVLVRDGREDGARAALWLPPGVPPAP